MKNKQLNICIKIIILLMISLASCKTNFKVINNNPIQKRKYQKGFWVKNTSRNQKNRSDIAESPNVIPEEIYDSDYNTLLSSTDNSIEMLLRTKSESSDSIKCDQIILINGDEIEAKIIEITENTVKYKKCDFLDGPVYTITKSKIFKIKYSNNSQELISNTNNDQDPEYIPNKNNTVEQNIQEDKNKINKNNTTQPPKRKVQHPLVYWGWLSSGAGLVFFSTTSAVILSLGLGILGLALSIAALAGILKESDKYVGQGWTILSILVSVFVIILALIVI